MEKEFKKLVEPNTKQCIDCKDEHYIPNDKERCLPCGFRKSKMQKHEGF